MRIPGSRRGYSLTEVLVVVAIVGIISSTGALMLIQLQNYYLMTTARNEIQRDARNSLDIMDRFLRQATSSSIVIDTPSNQGYFSRISFTTVDGRTMKFYQSGNKLIQVLGTTQSTLSSNLAYIAFCFPETDYPKIVNVSLAMSKNIQQGKKKYLQLSIQDVRIMN